MSGEMLTRSTPIAKVKEALANADPNAIKEELIRLRLENSQLRVRIKSLEARTVAGDEAWEERQAEYERLIEEKSETIRTLHMQIQELKENGPASHHGVRNEANPQELAEIERVKEELEEQRRQIEEDEKTLFEQAKQMELAMAKDRAELARQRTELQRLHADLNREIEMASRDPLLRERLMNLQRRQFDSQSGVRRPGSTAANLQTPQRPGTTIANQAAGNRPATMTSVNVRPTTQAGINLDDEQSQPPPKPKSGFFKRLFG
jgi:chromosome segregation ATPase